MANWATLSEDQHRNSLFRVPRTMRHTAAVKVVPVLKAELPRVVAQYVLAFVEAQDKTQLVALLGSTGDHHLYLNADGSWHGSYVPAVLRGYPFKTVSLEDDRLGLAIDTDVLTDDPDHGQPLFDAEGGLSEQVTRSMEFLKQCHVNQVATDQAVEILKDHDLLCAWSDKPQEEPGHAKGLLQIDPARLDSLSSDEVATLKGAPLAIAYAQIYARGQLDMLMRRAQELKQDLEFAATKRENTPNIGPSFLEEAGQETLIFDFDT